LILAIFTSKIYPATGLKRPDGWLKEPKFERYGQKRAFYSPIGSKGVKNREKRKKIGRNVVKKVKNPSKMGQKDLKWSHMW
jgi:hypothetical protein